jgi:NTP pyrophosphatase (non-canonical NTP hydrolase)
MKHDMTIKELIKDAHERAKAKGWWEGETNVPEKLCLVHSEISEALESYRDNEPHVFISENGKPEGFAIELADAVIRIADLCGHLGIDLAYAVDVKSEFNERRPYRHGGKKA